MSIDRDRTRNWATNNRRSAIRSIGTNIDLILLENNSFLAVLMTIAAIVRAIVPRIISGIVIDRCGCRRIITCLDYLHCTSRIWRDQERANR